MKDWGKINECSDNYIKKRNEENMSITTLKEEQHEVIQHICAIRHDIHCASSGMFNSGTSEYELWNYLDDDNENSLNNLLKAVNLPIIEYAVDIIDVPSDMDYFEFLDENEKEEWENKAKEINANTSSTLKHTGYSLWMEESGEYQEYIEAKEKINTQIENYLATIDKIYGTEYCPSGNQRL